MLSLTKVRLRLISVFAIDVVYSAFRSYVLHERGKSEES